MATAADWTEALGLPPEGGRVLIVAAHPDDETIAAASLLMQADRIDVRLLHVTDGAPRNGRDAARAGFPGPADYAAARRAELEAALAEVGFPAIRAERLDCPDQEAARHLAELSGRLLDRLAADPPDVVLTHAYEGGHPDHDAAAFAARAACDLLARAGRPAPRLFEAPFYRAGGEGEPLRPHHQSFLPLPQAPARSLYLSREQQAAKRRMLGGFVTQAGTLDAFSVEAERVRPAPRHAFTRPPHDGPLLYETWGLGMTGTAWRAHADDSLATLGLEGARWL